jgi:hypothetical protein
MKMNYMPQYLATHTKIKINKQICLSNETKYHNFENLVCNNFRITYMGGQWLMPLGCFHKVSIKIQIKRLWKKLNKMLLYHFSIMSLSYLLAVFHSIPLG